MVPALEPVESWAALGPIQRRLGSLLYATWTMMAMPTVAQAREAITTDARASVPERDRVRPVKVIDLRRLVHRSERSGSSNR